MAPTGPKKYSRGEVSCPNVSSAALRLIALQQAGGVPGKLARLLEALHSTVNVGFEIEEVRVVIDSIIGVKQGGLLGPQLFIFHICAIMQARRVDHGQEYEQCRFRTRMDGPVCSRKYQRADLRYDLQRGFVRLDGEFGGGLKQGHGGVLEFRVMDSEYADDTGLVFGDRATAARTAPLVNAHFARWGMEVHEKKPADTKVKTLVLFCAAPPSEYRGPSTFDGAYLSDIKLPSGNVVPVVDRAKYLDVGSMLGRDGTDRLDVEARIAAATRAFGSLSTLVFKSTSVSPAAKREAYVALVLSILLYRCEGWSLTAALWGKLRSFHHRCARSMCRVTMWHVREHRITTASVLKVLGLRNVETYVCRRQLQWAGHVARMGPGRLPRQLLSSWCGRPRPVGRPEMTFGATLEAALTFAGVEVEGWMWSWHRIGRVGGRWSTGFGM